VIVADSSAWVDYLRGAATPLARRFGSALEDDEVAVTEVVVGEVLAGARDPRHRADLLGRLLAVPVLTLGGLDGFEEAGDLYALCRKRGVTIRRFTDCLIAVPALRAGAAILHGDRDFDHMARVTDLQVVPL